jgi:predicted RNA-binding protein
MSDHTRHWLCVTIPHNWKIVRERSLWGVDDRYEFTLKNNVSVGDIFVFYVAKNGVGGIYKVISDYFYDNTPVGWVNKRGQPYPYPHRVNIEKIILKENPLPMNAEIRKELVFITDKSKSWMVFVFPSMVLIPEEDFEKIKSLLQNSQAGSRTERTMS